MYLNREAEESLEALRSQFKVVLVTGARQVGKTTMLGHLFPDGFEYLSLDDARLNLQANEDPALFFKDHRPPLIVDEVQKAPKLFPEIKLLVDSSQESGSIILTGSQTYRLMHESSETLAGRLAVLEMSGLSLRERLGLSQRGPYVPGVNEGSGDGAFEGDLWELIWRGSMPALLDPDFDWDYYYSNYTRTYLERDVRDLIKTSSEENFYRFLVACAARTASVLNVSDLARDAGIDVKTAKGWLSILKASGIIRLLRPFSANASKRVTKAPKLFFMDTGLVCHLLGWTNSRVARDGAMSGALFETFAVSEVLKSYLNDGRNAGSVYFYRDERKREIDLVIQDGRTLHPVEVKRSASPGKEALKNFSVLADASDFELGEGAVLCQTDRAYSLSDSVRAVPLTCI